MSRWWTVTSCPASLSSSARARAKTGARCRPPAHPSATVMTPADGPDASASTADAVASTRAAPPCAQHRDTDRLVVGGHVPQLRRDVRVAKVVAQVDGQVRGGGLVVQVAERDDLDNSHEDSRSRRGGRGGRGRGVVRGDRPERPRADSIRCLTACRGRSAEALRGIGWRCTSRGTGPAWPPTWPRRGGVIPIQLSRNERFRRAR